MADKTAKARKVGELVAERAKAAGVSDAVFDRGGNRYAGRVAAIADGGFARLIKAKEFQQHDPEMFALYASTGIVLLCATVIAFVLPVTLPPLLLPCVPLALGVLTGPALGCFHRRE